VKLSLGSSCPKSFWISDGFLTWEPFCGFLADRPTLFPSQSLSSSFSIFAFGLTKRITVGVHQIESRKARAEGEEEMVEALIEDQRPSLPTFLTRLRNIYRSIRLAINR
jgi:hypothetical protein